MYPLPLFLFLFVSWACRSDQHHPNEHSNFDTATFPKRRFVKDIPPPEGFERIQLSPGSFGDWLRNISLKDDNRVFLFNGTLKGNQSAQYAVIDIPVGRKDLQQCADAVMRFRAEYLFEQKRYGEIVFTDNCNKRYAWSGNNNKDRFDQYLETVFSFCNTASLQKQLTRVMVPRDIQPGDIFIKGGFPGHAMIVMDVAVNSRGQKVIMLAQSYMPAQDIHVVRNPSFEISSPWYDISVTPIVTPEWTFYQEQLYRF